MFVFFILLRLVLGSDGLKALFAKEEIVFALQEYARDAWRFRFALLAVDTMKTVSNPMQKVIDIEDSDRYPEMEELSSVEPEDMRLHCDKGISFSTKGEATLFRIGAAQTPFSKEELVSVYAGSALMEGWQVYGLLLGWDQGNDSFVIFDGLDLSHCSISIGNTRVTPIPFDFSTSFDQFEYFSQYLRVHSDFHWEDHFKCPRQSGTFIQVQNKAMKVSDMISSYLSGGLGSIATSAAGTLVDTISGDVGEHMRKAVDAGVNNELGMMLSRSLTPDVRKLLVPSLALTMTDSVTNALSSSLKEYLTESITNALTPLLVSKLSNRVSTSLPVHVTEPLTKDLSMKIINQIAPLLSQTVSISASSALSHTLYHSPLMDYYCYYCYEHELYCEYCRYAPEQSYYAQYYAQFYGTYYSRYWSDLLLDRRITAKEHYGIAERQVLADQEKGEIVIEIESCDSTSDPDKMCNQMEKGIDKSISA